MQATLSGARFDELNRIRETMAQARAHREQSITNNGHGLAMTAPPRASAPSPVSTTNSAA